MQLHLQRPLAQAARVGAMAAGAVSALALFGGVALADNHGSPSARASAQIGNPALTPRSASPSQGTNLYPRLIGNSQESARNEGQTRSTAARSTAPAEASATSPAASSRSGSGVVAVVAPTRAQTTTKPVTTLGATAGPLGVSNATQAPTTAGVATCPLVGVGVRGYGCSGRGSALAVVSAPTRTTAATAPSSTTAAHLGNITVSNTTTAPVTAGAATCPVVGVAVRGYGCGHPGSGAVAAFAPTQVASAAAPSSSTRLGAGNVQVANHVSAPAGASAATCPSAGVAVRGYSCGRTGSGLAVVQAPTRLAAGASPGAQTSARTGSAHIGNTTSLPVAAGAATCPLVGLFVHGYGCGNPGSAAAVLFAPSRAGLVATPNTSTAAGAGNLQINNRTTMPASAGLVTCPLIGIGVRGYGCGNGGSATAVAFVPTAVNGSMAPTSTTGAAAGGIAAGNTTTLPTSVGVVTCPLAGIGVNGYGCGGRSPRSGSGGTSGSGLGASGNTGGLINSGGPGGSANKPGTPAGRPQLPITAANRSHRPAGFYAPVRHFGAKGRAAAGVSSLVSIPVQVAVVGGSNTTGRTSSRHLRAPSGGISAGSPGGAARGISGAFTALPASFTTRSHAQIQAGRSDHSGAMRGSSLQTSGRVPLVGLPRTGGGDGYGPLPGLPLLTILFGLLLLVLGQSSRMLIRK